MSMCREQRGHLNKFRHSGLAYMVPSVKDNHFFEWDGLVL